MQTADLLPMTDLPPIADPLTAPPTTSVQGHALVKAPAVSALKT
jgi:hypothetical protein